MTTGGINAKAVFIRWQETDFQTPTTTTTDSAAAGSTTASTGNTAVTSTPSATATAESNASVSSTATSNQGSEGSSSKAWIAGPVVGAVVACALIAFLATWYNRRKMRQQKSLPNPRNHMSELPAYQPEEFEARPPKVPVELPAYGT